MRGRKFFVSILLSAVLILTGVYISPAAAGGTVILAVSPALSDLTGEFDRSLLTDYEQSIDESAFSEAAGAAPGDGELVEVIIELKDAPLMDIFLERDTGLMSASDFALSGEGQRIADDLSGSILYLQRLIRSRGIEFYPLYSYNMLLNGCSAKVRYGDIAKIEALRDVSSVSLSEIFVTEADIAGEEAPQFDFVTSSLTGITLTNNGMFDTSSAGNGGEGRLISVLDTGALLSHEAFKEPDAGVSLKYSSATYLTTQKVTQLKAKGMYSGASSANLFKNKKVPYAFDYADKDTDVTPGTETSASHGTHVAGIAAGNNGKGFKGSAPDAQLAVMKVFADSSNGAYASAIIAALEDSVIIGADAINMSLGSAAGFSYDAATGANNYDKVFAKIQTAGISLYCSAGNSYNSSYSSPVGTNGKTSNPDTGVISSSASYSVPVAVANCSKTGSMSTSTSWGPAPDLSIKPEITAPGSSISSAMPTSSTSYGNKTGTSMASPNIAGLSMVLKNNLKAKYPSLTAVELSELTDRVMMSTAYIITDSAGNVFSPRAQGAGVAHIAQAARTPAHLYVPNKQKSKVELGDDKARSGVYDFEFSLKNMSDTELSYIFEMKTVTEGVKTQSGGINVVTQTPYKLRPVTRLTAVQGGGWSANTPEGISITVSPYSECTVSAGIALSASDIKYLEANFENGMYVEGFVVLKAKTSAAVNLNMPFLAFYGDWTAQPVFDVPGWDSESPAVSNTVVEGHYLEDGDAKNVTLGTYTFNLGPGEADVPASKSKIALGYDDGTVSSITGVRTSLLRNVRKIDAAAFDADTGEMVSSAGSFARDNRKAYYNSTDKEFSVLEISGDLVTPKQAGLPGNARYELTFTPTLDYNEETGTSFKVPFTVDFESPLLIGAKISGDVLSVDLFDNHYLQAFQIYYKKGGAYLPLADYFSPGRQDAPGEKYSCDYAVNSAFRQKLAGSDDGNIYIYMIDYARNESWFSIDPGANAEHGRIVQPAAEPDLSAGKNLCDSTQDHTAEDEFLMDGAVRYRIVPNGYELVSYPEAMRDKTYSVLEGTVRIGDNALSGNDFIENLVLPPGLRRIGSGALEGLGSLSKVVLPETAPALETRYGADYYRQFSAAGTEKDTEFYLPEETFGYDSYLWKNVVTVTHIYMPAAALKEAALELFKNITANDLDRLEGLYDLYEILSWIDSEQAGGIKTILDNSRIELGLIASNDLFLERISEITA